MPLDSGTISSTLLKIWSTFPVVLFVVPFSSKPSWPSSRWMKLSMSCVTTPAVWTVVAGITSSPVNILLNGLNVWLGCYWFGIYASFRHQASSWAPSIRSSRSLQGYHDHSFHGCLCPFVDPNLPQAWCPCYGWYGCSNPYQERPCCQRSCYG